MLIHAVAADDAAQHQVLANSQRRLSVRHKAQAALKDAHAVLLAVLVIHHGVQQAGPQGEAHRRHLAGDRARQDQRLFARVQQLLNFRVDEAVGDHFLVAFIVKQRFYALEREVSFFMLTHDKASLHRLVGNAVIAVDAGNLFHQVFFNLHIEAPARGNGLPLVLSLGDFAAEAAQNVAHLSVGNVVADQAIELAAAQGDSRTLRQRRIIGDVDNRAGFTAADIDQQASRALHGLILQSRIDAALVAVGGIGVQTVAARAAGDGQRAEEGALQQHVLRFVIHTGVFAAEDTAHRQRFTAIGNDQRIGIQFGFAAVKQSQGFALFRHAHYDAAVDAVAVKGVHRLAQLKQDVVGDVHHGVDGADAAAAQLLFHPQRRRRLNVDAFHYAAQIARAGVRRLNGNWQSIGNGRRNRRHLRHSERLLVKHRHVAGDADNAEAVGAVRGDAYLDGVVIKLQIVANIGADRRVRGQLDNAAVVVGNAQLGEGAKHPFRRLAAQFGSLDFEVARQHGADGGNRHLQALAAVRRAADDVQQAFAADVDFCHPQLVSIRMLAALDHFAHDHAVEAARNRLDAVHFQARHGDLVRQRVAVNRRVNPLA